jgi:hypothetical protein
MNAKEIEDIGDIENFKPLTYDVLMDHNLSLSVENHIPFAFNNVIADAYTDEQLTNELRSILIVRNDETRMESRELDKYIKRVAHTFIASLVALPFPICDLHYAYTDTSCIPNTIPTNYIDLNMKLYLLLCGYVVIVGVVVNILSTLFNLNSLRNGMIRCNNITRPAGVLLHAYGATIFWGYLDTRHSCNNQVYAYLLISITMKVVGNIISNGHYLHVKFK